MGRVVKDSGRFNFNRLAGIRNAFEYVLPKAGTGDTFNDGNLEVLESLRNVLVHNAGIVDADFDKRRKANKNAFGTLGDIPMRQPVRISGGLVKQLAETVLATCEKIVEISERAIARNTKKNGNEGITFSPIA
jgi:hypothetical protein